MTGVKFKQREIHGGMLKEGNYLWEPDRSRKVYATVALSYHETYAGHDFAIGDEVQDVLPADILKACLDRGDVSFTRPAPVKKKEG